MDISFIKPTLEHQELIRGYFDRYQSRSCERCFANIYLWIEFEQVKFAEICNTLVFRRNLAGTMVFSWPAGEKEDIGRALKLMERYAAEEFGQPLCLFCMTPAFFSVLEELQPGRWEITYNRDFADYIYERDQLANLSGKKFHGKRNHIHRFEERYPDWHYEPLSKENAADARKVALKWREENSCDAGAGQDLDEGKSEELCVCLREIEMFDELHLTGGILYTGNEPVAFSIGEQLSDDTFVVHVEKALADVQGAYPMINREFVRHECGAVLYINREDDTGAPGLRKAKLSYKPVMLEEKGVAVCKTS